MSVFFSQTHSIHVLKILKLIIIISVDLRYFQSSKADVKYVELQKIKYKVIKIYKNVYAYIYYIYTKNILY